MRTLIFKPLHFGSRVFGKMSRVLQKLSADFAPKDIQRKLVSGSTWYDMLNAPDERYYATLYWSVMTPFLDGLPDEAQCLDLGCGQGRFSLRLAMQFPQGQVLGYDISESAIASAQQNAEKNKLNNMEFQVASIDQMLQSCPPNSRDVVIMTEVTFFYPDWEKHMSEIVRTLRPGGLLVMTYRSQYFNALCLVKDRLWHNSNMLLNERRGRVFGSLVEFSWQTSAEICSLLEDDYNLDLLDLRGIGVCSGIPGDPHYQIAQPSKLNSDEQDCLIAVELELGRNVPDAGRYILAIAKKTL